MLVHSLLVARQRSAAVALLAVLVAVLVGPAGPAAAEVQGWAYDLSNELMSPYCPGRTLSECPSDQAQTLRMWLIVQESAGRSREEVLEELVERYGEEILAAPRARGFGLSAYLLPVVVFLAGGVLVVFFLRRQTRASRVPAPPAGPAAVDPELARLVDEDLSR